MGADSLSVGSVSVAYEIKISGASDADTDITYTNVSTNSDPMLSEQGVLTEG
jgi:hypothetical protein